MEKPGEEDEPNDSVSSPNDAFFKEIFSQPEHAIAFFQKHLPAGLAAGIKWESLTVLRDSHVGKDLRQLHSDLLFSVRIGEQESLLYLLFEHQSTVDPAMPLRLFGYVAQILAKAHRENGLPLPPVIPFVLHQGPDAWNDSTSFEDLFDLPEENRDELLVYLPKFQHALLDLTQIDPSEESENSNLQMVLYLMKLARDRDLLKYFRWLAKTLPDFTPADFLRGLLI